MGSGSLNAMAVFEASYKEDMTQQEAEALVARAIRSGTSLYSIRDLQHHLSDCLRCSIECCTDLTSSSAASKLLNSRVTLPV